VALGVIHGGASAGWLDFSVNLNPLGTDLLTVDAEAHLARDADVPAQSVLLTAGATEALRLVMTATVMPGQRVVIVGPTYGEYARVATLAGAGITEIRAEPPAFIPPNDRIIRAITSEGVRLVVLCDPNNPTAQQLAPRALTNLIDALPRDASLMIDQSFLPFGLSTLTASQLLSTGRVILVRSLTKLLAAPGVRLGYLIASPELVARMRVTRDPWIVGAHAIAAARSARFNLGRADAADLRRWRSRFFCELVSRGLRPIPSAANYVLVQVSAHVDRVHQTLARRRIAVRACASFGLGSYLRVAVRPPAEQDMLLAVLDIMSDELRS
jgi:histidinol-phosphate aminotransferase